MCWVNRVWKPLQIKDEGIWARTLRNEKSLKVSLWEQRAHQYYSTA